MADPLPSFLASPSRPKLKLPPGACDAHVHVFGPYGIFPFAEDRPFAPADAPKENLFALRRPSPWEDAIPFARTLVAEFGDRCFWGSDWPHPNLTAVPDDGVLVDLLAEIAPSEKQRQALLVDNPRGFYRFRR
jgi:predicted TIM-barrel fold metal-dependent hydrolase